ncbi:hypothetical protein [Pseudomonas sp. UMAB-40]|uniref:hypothetical protein n=1 Tax=Pseudomonas sp. UMAB-40 TaxID=1365407 RepID=UPI001C587C21|nr:hypothetical protein [Pseudomonas sp. UMAB-40]
MIQNSNVIGITPKARDLVQPSKLARGFGAQAALNKITATFTDIATKANVGHWNDDGKVKRQGITYGAYNAMSYRAADGSVMHSCGQTINEMRDKRQFTHNAIELRCDALGLVIYVGGVTQVNPSTRVVMTAIRLACYQHKQMKPELIIVADAEALYRACHNVLLTTFNRLGREYNIAGLTREDLTLVSDSERLPNIVLTEPI